MENKARRAAKRRGNGGFTFTEMLIAVMILALAGIIVTEAISLAAGRYREQLRQSKAQMLCATVSTFVQNELTYANDIASDGGVVTFRSNARVPGAACRFIVENGGGSQDVTGSAGEAGELYLAWGTGSSERFAIVDEAFYESDGLLAGLALTWQDEDASVHAEQFHVTVTVSDTDGSALSTSDFYVSPVSP